MDSCTIPTPLDPLPNDIQEKRLWIGNLDSRVNEYQLLQILLRFGEIEKFDLLFHRSGPLEGQPRGYAFVTYKNNADAVNAKVKLHDKKIGNKHIAVKWAHSINTDEWEKAKKTPNIPALAGARKEARDPKYTIQAIEAKLKLMEKTPVIEPDFTIKPSTGSSSSSGSSNSSQLINGPKHSRDRERRCPPYSKTRRK